MAYERRDQIYSYSRYGLTIFDWHIFKNQVEKKLQVLLAPFAPFTRTFFLYLKFKFLAKVWCRGKTGEYIGVGQCVSGSNPDALENLHGELICL